MLEQYKTVKGFGKKEIIIERSRFIGYVNRAETEEAAHAFIDKIKKQHRDATHNCSAYLIGEHDHIQKANDDGEPSGTAGVPMLETLKKQGLKDVVVVVTRYFGGIKLGAGGLVRAYTQGTTAGLQAAGLIERNLYQLMNVSIEYHLLGKLENELRNQNVYILKTIDYLEKVTLQILLPINKEEQFIDWVNDLTNGQAYLSKSLLEYVDTEI